MVAASLALITEIIPSTFCPHRFHIRDRFLSPIFILSSFAHPLFGSLIPLRYSSPAFHISGILSKLGAVLL